MSYRLDSRQSRDPSPPWRPLALALALLSLGSCASVPFDQPNHRKVMERLAALDFIDSIHEAFFE